MKRLILFIALFLMTFTLLASAQRIAFISMGDNGPFTEPALNFCKKAFDTSILTRKDLTTSTLTKYAVVWWHDGDSDPGALKDQEIGAFVDYAKAGGAILLSAWAIRYATPMGLENADARQFGPVADDGINVGITIREDMKDLPIWNGLTNIDKKPAKAGDRVQVNSTGYPKSGDYFDKIWKNFITVADAWGPPANDWGDRIAAFGYWQLGKGKVFNMNWRLPNFHANNKDIDMLNKLTTNLINWLASSSAFFAVNPKDKATTTWANIKAK